MDERSKMLKYSRLIWLLLLLFLIVSCGGNAALKDNSAPQGGVTKEEAKDSPFNYVLGPRDEITIYVWKDDNMKRSLQIDPNGNIQYPLLGEIKAAGLTTAQLSEKIASGLSRYYVNPRVDINVGSLQSLKVHILGEVQSPTTTEWRSGMYVWEAIAKAGGFSSNADMANVLILRVVEGKGKIIKVNVKDVLDGGKREKDMFLANNDIVYVKPTTISDIEKFMIRFGNILSPILSLQRAIILWPDLTDAVSGASSNKYVISD